TKRYPGCIEKLGAGVWRIRLCVAGKYQRFTMKGTKQQAKNFAVTKHDELAGDTGRAANGLPSPVRLSELMEEFTAYELPTLSEGTQISYGNSFKAFRAFFVEKRGVQPSKRGLPRDPMVREIRRGHV